MTSLSSLERKRPVTRAEVDSMIRELTPAQMLALDFGAFMDRVKEEVDADRVRNPSHPFLHEVIQDRVQEAEDLVVSLDQAPPEELAKANALILQRCIEIAALAARLAIEGDPAFANTFKRPGSLAFPETTK